MKGNEQIIISDESIEIIGNNNYVGVVMHSAERGLMLKLAEIATKNGGDILEIGFGMHISADFIQSNPMVTSHTIIEIHPQIYKQALIWAKDKPNTKIILGDWIDILPTLNEKFDGVLHDTYSDTNAHKFLNYVKPNCKVGTIVAFFDSFKHDANMVGVRIPVSDDDINALSYLELDLITNNKTHNSYSASYELQYTIFNGNTFIKDVKDIKQLL